VTVYTNNSAGAASGTTITTANSDDNSAGDALGVVTGTRVYDNTWAHSGTTSFKSSGAAASGFVGFSAGTSANATFQGWFWFNALPATTQGILQCRIASPDSNGGEVQVQSNGRIRLGLDGWISNTVLSTSTAYRLETCWTAGATASTGRVRLALFLGDDLVPLETHATNEVNTGTTTFSGYRFGKLTSSGTWDVWWDDVTYNDGGTSFITSNIAYKEGSIQDTRVAVVGTGSTSETVTLPDYASGDVLVMFVARDTTSGSAFSGDSDVSVTEVATGNRKLSALILTPINTSITSFTLSNSTSAKWRWWISSLVGIDSGYAIEYAHNDIGSNTTNALDIPSITTTHGNTVDNGVAIAGASVTSTATWNPITSTHYYSTTGDTAMSIGVKTPSSGSGTVTWAAFDRGNSGSSRDESAVSLYFRPYTAEATADSVSSVSVASASAVVFADPSDISAVSSVSASSPHVASATAISRSRVRVSDGLYWDGDLFYDDDIFYDPSPSSVPYVIAVAVAVSSAVSSVSAAASSTLYGLGTLAATSSVSVSANSVLLAAADTSSAVSAVSVDAVVRSSASASAAAVSSVSVSSVVISYSSATVSSVSSVSASALSVTYASTVSAAVSDVSISSATQYAYGIAASNVVSAVSGAATVLMYGTALSSVVSSVSISGYTADYGIASVDIVSVASAAAVLRSYGQASIVSTSELSLSGLAVLFSSVSISSSFSVSVSATAVYVGSAVCITSSLVEVVFAEAVITPAYVSPIISISSIVVVGGLLFEASVSTSALASTVEVHIYKDMPALRNLSAENMSSFYDATSLSVVGEGALTADLLPFSDAALLVDTDFGDLTEVVSAEASLSL